MKIKLIATTLLIGSAFAAMGYGIGEFSKGEHLHGHAESAIHDENVIEVHASWMEGSETLADLVDKSDLVVIGTLDEELGAYQPFDGEDDTFTDAKIHINQVLKGDAKDIIISQYGGVRPDGKVEVFHDVPILKKNKKQLFFLTKIEDSTLRNGKYQYTNGIEGLFSIDKETVDSSADTALTKEMSNRDFQDIVKEIKTITKP
ncbi:hypothetical protein LC085_17045 [Bacillus tianshenii]|uniref:hypothetical protein n=1 Tax=Sutcliffiella tianshenii TaxID=1463404 RepID=UPI001CD5D76C|nr:hypothetical protein [Bacillus tianshenii]MCA1321615.1 hypothetical protein [Bacillus tianshenii]